MLCRVACVLSFVAVMVWSEEWEWERFDNTAHAGDFLGPESGRKQTLRECKASCSADARCAGFSFEGGGRCWMHTAVASANREQLSSTVYDKKKGGGATRLCLQPERGSRSPPAASSRLASPMQLPKKLTLPSRT